MCQTRISLHCVVLECLIIKNCYLSYCLAVHQNKTMSCLLAWEEDRLSNNFWSGPERAAVVCTKCCCKVVFLALLIVKTNYQSTLKSLKGASHQHHQILRQDCIHCTKAYPLISVHIFSLLTIHHYVYDKALLEDRLIEWFPLGLFYMLFFWGSFQMPLAKGSCERGKYKSIWSRMWGPDRWTFEILPRWLSFVVKVEIYFLWRGLAFVLSAAVRVWDRPESA